MGGCFVVVFVYLQVCVILGGYLWQVGYIQYLLCCVEGVQFLFDYFGYGVVDIGVDFVEDYGVYVVFVECSYFDGQVDVGQFVVGGYFVQGVWWLFGVGVYQQFVVFVFLWIWFVVGCGFQFDLQYVFGYVQFIYQGVYFVVELFGGCQMLLVQLFCCCGVFVLQLFLFCGQCFECFVGVFQFGQFFVYCLQFVVQFGWWQLVVLVKFVQVGEMGIDLGEVFWVQVYVLCVVCQVV